MPGSDGNYRGMTGITGKLRELLGSDGNCREIAGPKLSVFSRTLR